MFNKLSNGDFQDMYNSALVLNEILIVFTTNKPFQNDNEKENYESKEER